MNNNRGNNNNNNNRRRGRGNNNRPQGGGAQGGGPQVNRIDSRARGNAPQLLEKYRKLAHDAHLTGDRVTAEYYLQFADHYFRVIADTRLRQEEARARRDDRWQENGESGPRDDSDESGEFSVEADFPAFDQPPVYTRRDREDRPAERGPDRGPERGPERGPDRGGEPAPERANDRGNPRGGERGNDFRRRDERPVQNEAEAPRDAEQPQEPEVGDARSVYEPPENPFVRTERGDRGLRPRREGPRDSQRDAPRDAQRDAPRDVPREPRRPRRDDRPQSTRAAEEAPATTGLDPTLLPPAISATRREPEGDGEAQAAPTPRRRARRKPVDDTGEALESVS